MQTLMFLNEPLKSLNKEARISKIKKNKYFVTNLNTPYLGTISEIWTKKDLVKKIKNKEIEVV